MIFRAVARMTADLACVFRMLFPTKALSSGQSALDMPQKRDAMQTHSHGSGTIFLYGIQ